MTTLRRETGSASPTVPRRAGERGPSPTREPTRWSAGPGATAALVITSVVLAVTTVVLVLDDGPPSALDTASRTWVAPVIVLLGAICVVALVTAVTVSRSASTQAMGMSSAMAEALGAVNEARDRELVARFQSLDRSESELVSNLSHELRTPLTSILGYSELLNDHLVGGPGSDPLPREAVEMIQRNGERLLILVDDLLTLSAIESSEVELTRTPCDVTEVLMAAVTTLGPRARARRVQLVTDLRPTPLISADPGQIERVVLNLIDNAVKYSGERSTVRVSCAVVGGELEVRVEDQGLGIPSDELDRLFTRFYRVHAPGRGAITGTGLGLTIVASIVERHEGRVWLESEEGDGTTAIVRLPMELVGTDSRQLQEVT